MPDQTAAEMSALISREQQVEKATGVSHRVIDCFRSYRFGHPDYRPLHFGAILSIASMLGADFTNEWIRLAGQGAFDLPDEEPSPGDLAADTTDDTAAIVRAAKDGTFDNDRDSLPAVGSRMIERGMQLVAVGGRG